MLESCVRAVLSRLLCTTSMTQPQEKCSILRATLRLLRVKLGLIPPKRSRHIDSQTMGSTPGQGAVCHGRSFVISAVTFLRRFVPMLL